MASASVRAFRVQLRALLNTTGKRDEQLLKAQRELRELVSSLDDGPELRAMLEAYLAEYKSLEARGDKRSGFISASVFEHLFAEWTRATTFFDPLLRRSYDVLVARAGRPPIQDAVHERYATLPAVAQATIVGHLRAKQALKRDSLSLFEILLDLFFTRHGWLPDSDDELFAFDPAPDETLAKELDSMQGVVATAFAQGNVKALEQGLRGFTRWSAQNDDVARCFQIFLWCRRRAEKKSSGPYLAETWIRDELYMLSAQRILRCALNKGYGFVIRGFLSDEEVELLLAPLAQSVYYSDFADRFFPFRTRDAGGAGASFNDLGIAHLSSLIFAERMEFNLLSAEEMDEVLDARIQQPAAERSRSVFIPAELGAVAREVRVDDVIEGRATVVRIEDHGRVTFVWKGLEHRLFSARPRALGQLVSNVFMEELVAGTQHLLVLIPALFELLQYVASLCLGGVPGLLEELAETLVFDAATSLAERYIDNQAVLTALGALDKGSLAIPSRALAKGALKSVRTARTLLKRPLSALPRARVVGGGRFRLKTTNQPKTPKSDPRARIPKPKLARKRYYDTANLEDARAYQALAKKAGLRRVPLNEHAMTKSWGQYQASVMGGKQAGFVAQLSDGSRIQPDGLQHSSEAKGKLDLLEAKHEDGIVTLENFEATSLHFKHIQDKLQQMQRYAQFARQYSKYVHKVRYLCSSKATYDAYENLRRQWLPEHLRRYVVLELDPRAAAI